MLRVAEALKTWMDDTGTEACGPIAQAKDGKYFVQLATEKAQTVCLRAIMMPDSMADTGGDIHSHPVAKNGGYTVRLTTQDFVALEALGRVKLVDDMRRMNIRTLPLEPDTFSPNGYAAGPGYLVVKGQLLYQHGEGTARVNGAIAGPVVTRAMMSDTLRPPHGDGNWNHLRISLLLSMVSPLVGWPLACALMS
ncbi:hypothetical protein [Dyella sedimenti]|uniref:hypothetical protein n=1 Tax=Dyella sedimenti TaxID=2919947 RepID=UPI001FAA526A|nr:hypothetical protein [Dyella sedimenti]